MEEGIINWEFGRPYLIAHDEDGYCVHLDRENYRCMVWEDYIEMMVNEGLMEQIEDSNRKVYDFIQSGNMLE